MTARGRWHLSGAVALLALLVAPLVAPPSGGVALAHAGLVASSPGAGSVVPESPPEIRLVFSEPLEAQATSLDLVREDGTALLERAGEIDPADPYALVVRDPALADGVYSLTWRTLSAADGHTAEGSFSFGVGEVSVDEADAEGAMTHTESDPLRAAGRWFTYVGLLLALGMAVFHRVVIRDGPMPSALARLLAAGLGVSALATLVAAVASGLEAGAVVDYLFRTRNGALQLARALVAAAGAVTLVAVARRAAGPVPATTGLVGIGLLVAAGHAAASADPAAIVVQVVHVVAAAIWTGGLAGLLLLLVRPTLLTSGPAPKASAVVPRFSALALVAIGLVSLTGVYSAWAQTGALVTADTEYGRTLIAKSAIVLAAFGLGGLNYFDGGRMKGWIGGFRPRLTVELAAAAAVLVATALLATTPPVEEAAGVRIEPVPDAFGFVAPGMEMEVVPGRPGVNRIVVTTTDAMAAASALELVLDRLDEGTTTRVPLTMSGASDASGGGHAGMSGDAGTVEWTADAVVLPARSDWDTSVRVLSSTGNELTRQRYAFEMGDAGVAGGAVTQLLTPALGIGVLLLVGGALALGLGLGGMTIPRCDPLASRVALVGAGAVSASLGAIIGVARFIS